MSVAVPTRAYCAAFTALGVVMEQATTDGVFVKTQQHFDRLSALPLQSDVYYRDGDRKLKGKIVEVGSMERNLKEERFIKVQVQPARREFTKVGQAGGKTYIVWPEFAHNVENATKAHGELPSQQKGQSVRENADFASHFFENQLSGVALDSQVLCTIVGRSNSLVREIKETKLALQTPEEDKQIAGALQDIIRIRRFGRESEQYFAEVVPLDATQDQPGSESSPIVIFDGSTSFLKRRDDWRGSSWIVIVDRTEQLFDEAVEVLNQDYLKRRKINSEIDSVFSLLPDAPAGVELFAYMETC